MIGDANGSIAAYVAVSVGLVSVLALVGIVALVVGERELHRLLTYLVSFAAGTLLGSAFLHLLPEATEAAGFDVEVGLYLLGGLLFAFGVEKYLHWHHHHHHRQDAPADEFDDDDQPGTIAYMILLGDGVHNLVDGVIIAASYAASIPLGVATTLAIAFHEIPQELGDFGVLVYGGMSYRRALGYNFLTALSAFVGAGVVLLTAGGSERIARILLPVAAGNFVYVAGSDLLPELIHEDDAVRSSLQLAAVLVGVGLMYLLAP